MFKSVSDQDCVYSEVEQMHTVRSLNLDMLYIALQNTAYLLHNTVLDDPQHFYSTYGCHSLRKMVNDCLVCCVLYLSLLCDLFPHILADVHEHTQ